MVETLIGLVGGFALSALFWYITVHIIAPTVRFSAGISRIRASDGTPRYRIKFKNVGRRGIIDIEVQVSVEFPKLQLQTVPPIRANRGLVMVDGRRFMRLGPRTGNQVVNLDVDEFLDSVRDGRVLVSLYPIDEQRAAVTLEDLLRRSPGANIQATILCYDEWSGARKCFRSKMYELADVRDGRFADLEIVSGR